MFMLILWGYDRTLVPNVCPSHSACIEGTKEGQVKPLFSVHAGEYLAGSHIERQFRNVNLWLPAKDTGVDLLVSDRANRQTVSLQVKFSKDFLVAHMQREAPEFQNKLRACGWWTLNSEKMCKSRA